MTQIEDIQKIKNTDIVFRNADFWSSVDVRLYKILYCRALLLDFLELNYPAFKELKVLITRLGEVRISLRYKNETFTVDSSQEYIIKKGDLFYYETQTLNGEYLLVMLMGFEGLLEVVKLLQSNTPLYRFELSLVSFLNEKNYTSRFISDDEFLQKIKVAEGLYGNIYEKAQLLLDNNIVFEDCKVGKL